MKRLIISAVLFPGFVGAVFFAFVKTLMGKRIQVQTLMWLALFCVGVVSSNAQCVAVAGVSITAPTEPNTNTVIKKMDVYGNLAIPDQSIPFTAGITTGSFPVTYEWYVDGMLQLNETGNTFTFITPTVEGVYTVYAAAVNVCTKRNTARSIEITVIVTKDVVLPPPCTAVSIVTITGAATIITGSSTTLSISYITPGATAPISYQWQWFLNGTWENIPGATSDTFNAVAAIEGTTQYRLVVTNCGGSETSNEISVIGQYNEVYNSNMKTYVGAFWKNEQSGERLIRMTGGSTYYGAWQATVIVGDSWIELDKVMTSDSNVGWLAGADENQVKDMNDPYNDLTYRITSGGASTVSGVMDAGAPQIYFRIGLKSTQPHGSNPRYGVVLLTYQNHSKSQRIFIRQGEEPDTPPGSSSYPRWSPYNLGNINNPTAYPYADPRFVAYPTQAGYFYQWAMPSGAPVPHHPVNPSAANVSGWVNHGNTADYALTNVCPSGYTLPTGGSSSNITNLMANTASVWGYYADGFFDRRKLCGPIGMAGKSETQVSWDNTNDAAAKNEFVAYAGALLYNISDNKSIFFPSAGLRLGGSNSGGLNSPGDFAGFWSRTLDGSNVWYWYVNMAGDIQRHMSTSSSYGYTIRCVIGGVM